MTSTKDGNAYDRLLTALFKQHWKSGAVDVPFTKDDLIEKAQSLGVKVKNLPDVLYTYRNRRPFPHAILAKGNWVIASRGPGRYAFEKVAGAAIIEVPHKLKRYNIPYAVPEIVARNIANDEQGLLTVVRYNRLLDVFTGVACFHLQTHIQTHVPKHGQVQIDDLYVGVDKNGAGYVLPVEAKDSGESLGIDKVVALTLFAQHKFPNLVCRPMAVIRQAPDEIACIEFEPAVELKSVSLMEMRCYRLLRED